MSGPTRFTFTGRDAAEIVAFRWEPDSTPRGVVQITHGVGEYSRRYSHVADKLVRAGFAVQAQDHRAHGATAASEARLGALGADGWTELVNDIGVLAGLGRERWPGLPVALLAHSLGSFATQQFLLDRSSEVEAVVMTGTSLLDQLEPSLDLDADVDLRVFNAGIDPARTEFDWLSRDIGTVDAYMGDPYCGFSIDVDGTKAMFAGARTAADPARLAGMRADLPVLVVVGEKDPVGGHGALPSVLVERYRAAGLSDVTLRVWEDARHEILNETNRDEVVAEIVTWLDRVLPAR